MSAASSSLTLAAPLRRVTDRPPPTLALPPVPGSVAALFVDGHRSFGAGHKR